MRRLALVLVLVGAVAGCEPAALTGASWSTTCSVAQPDGEMVVPVSEGTVPMRVLQCSEGVCGPTVWRIDEDEGRLTVTCDPGNTVEVTEIRGIQ